MPDFIILHTSIKLNEVRMALGPNNTSKANYTNLDKIELETLLGLFLYTSVFRSAHENMMSTFCIDPTEWPIFLATMSLKRFEVLLMCLRFDTLPEMNAYIVMGCNIGFQNTKQFYRKLQKCTAQRER